MFFGDWEAKIEERFDTGGYALWLRRKSYGAVELLNHKGEVKRIDRSHVVSNDDYFAYFENKEQLQALANALSTHGIKTNSDSKNEGILEATKFHLEDMRKIVFKKEKIK